MSDSGEDTVSEQKANVSEGLMDGEAQQACSDQKEQDSVKRRELVNDDENDEDFDSDEEKEEEEMDGEDEEGGSLKKSKKKKQSHTENQPTFCTPAVAKVRQTRIGLKVYSPSDSLMSPCTKLLAGNSKAPKNAISHPQSVLRSKQKNWLEKRNLPED